MKDSEGGSSALLNTCRLMEKSGVTYSMSLLALSGSHGRKDMVDLLLEEGAGNTKILKTQDKGEWHIPSMCKILGVTCCGNGYKSPKII